MEAIAILRRRTMVFPLACAAALAMLFISESAYRQSMGMLDQLTAITAASSRVQILQQSLLDVETGQRGYLVTGRPEHLQPYGAALQDVADAFEFLDRYFGDAAGPAAELAELHLLSDTRLAQLAAAIELRAGQPAQTIAVVMPGDLGREQMRAINGLAHALLAHEQQRMDAGRGELYQSLQLGRIGVAALSLMSLLALYLYLRHTSALKQQQLTLKRAVQTERDRLDIEVRRRTAQLTELTHHLQTAREDERHRLARNLHDELGALLTSAKLDAARIRSRLGGSAPEAIERLVHLVQTLDQSILLGRSIIEDLRPSTLDNLGLVATLEILTREFAARSGVQVIPALSPVRLAAPAELMVYRLVQEAVTNISKYAKAQRVWIELGSRGGVVDVSVRDDGVGFDTTVPPASAYGLVGMRFRVEAEGGVLDVVSAPGQGTRVQVRLPESAAPQAAAVPAAL